MDRGRLGSGNTRLGGCAAGQVVQRPGGPERGVDRQQAELLLPPDHRLDMPDRRSERLLVRPGTRVNRWRTALHVDLEPVLRGGMERVGDVDLPGGTQQPAERVLRPVEATRQQQTAAAWEAEASPRAHADPAV